MAIHSVFLPGKFHGQRSPWGHKQWDTTRRQSMRMRAHTHTHTHTQLIGISSLTVLYVSLWANHMCQQRSPLQVDTIHACFIFAFLRAQDRYRRVTILYQSYYILISPEGNVKLRSARGVGVRVPLGR